MLRLMRTAMKYLVIGLLFGLLFAPRSGRETRRMLRDEMVEYLNVLFRSAVDQVRGQSEGQHRS